MTIWLPPKKIAVGKITLMKFNTIQVNRIVSKVVSRIQAELDATPTIWVDLNLGTVSGLSFWKSFGPHFQLELEAAREN